MNLRTSSLLAMFVAVSALALPAHAASLAFDSDRLIVIPRESRGGINASAAQAAQATQEFARLGLTRGRTLGGPWLGERRPYVLEAPAGVDLLAAAAALRATGAYAAVTPNYRIPLMVTLPNDPYLSDQWYINGGFADVDLPLAWDLEQGSASVTIAILDTGVDTDHPDLASKIRVNAAEIAGNLLDDDANGFVDDVKGWDFGTHDADARPEYTTDPSGIDVGFHGTFCAGIAAAANDNAIGIAGAGWNCRILPLKISHPENGITSEAVAEAFTYAIDNGANVLSLSFGGPGDPGVPEFFQALVDLARAADIVCVAAAGNEGVSTPTYPAACDGVLAVAATDEGNARASFSNWGSWVDIAAPGAGMWSSICQNYEFTELDQIFYLFLFFWDGKNPYMLGDGTSFACPLVAGACGLVRSRWPALSEAATRERLRLTGDVVAYDHPIGPRMNVFRAVSEPIVAVVPASLGGALALTQRSANPSRGELQLALRAPAGGPGEVAVFDAVGRRVRTLARGELAPGVTTLNWDGRDEAGRPAVAGIYWARASIAGVTASTKFVRLR
ncbi:MAG: S8 family serine peptidase [Candidatus Eisenbacteria bacterium]|uniref:S8 family serine peptidase n=1 Tax=Eiseniibacteriota bacterium TaxID=2212470 RepID=A0A849SL98_UNCEI|nr:S8 family serine peptidase [Candidatus Eisenbacteria bacterium]